MANTELTTTPGGGGTQAATQTPQSATGSNTGAAASGVQPGTTSSLLETSSGGVQLQPTSLSTVPLGSQSATTASTAAQPSVRHTNAALFALPVILFVLAVLLFWFTSRSAKNTTHY